MGATPATGDFKRMTNRGSQLRARRSALRAGIFAMALFSAATAQQAPLPVGAPASATYVDADEAAQAVPYVEKGDPRDRNKVIAELTRALKRDPKHVGMLAERGYVHARGGDGDAAELDFAMAASYAGGRSDVLRHVYWSWGWARLALGDPREALAHWQNAARLHGGAPFWLPYSNAVALWRLEQRELAVAWFDTAVRSKPELATRDGVDALAAQWQDDERRTLEEVQVAWSTKPKT
jgi:tetratricopeptide (TPR) repeat protein